MLMLALLGCSSMGTFTTADGSEPIRTALYFLPDSALWLELYGARQAFVLLANSTLPCWPADDDGDPLTPAADTDLLYWSAQQATMLSREGGITIAFSLALGPEEDWLGRYSMHADAWETAAMAQYVQTDGRVATGAWYEVVEAAVAEGAGLDYALDGGIEVLEEEHEIGIGAPAWVDVARKDTVLTGTFDFAPAEYAGTFRAQHCDNLDILTTLYTQLAVFAIADGVLDEGGDTGPAWEHP
ncbi:MAG: hypothetical protein Q8P18_18560 [Pseudomonadota bacterium]|nr:hypothetical protein [Pseudomonadota bacterium]